MEPGRGGDWWYAGFTDDIHITDLDFTVIFAEKLEALAVAH